MRAAKLVVIAAFCVVVIAGVLCSRVTNAQKSIVSADYQWRLPKTFPTPIVPADNPMTEAKVELGRHLFYDTRLSINEKTSCATCHLQSLAFTDGKKVSVGTTGQLHFRNSMGLANVAYNPAFNWANTSVVTLERQPATPIFGEHPVEMGMSDKESLLIERIRKEPKYLSLFASAFPSNKDAISIKAVSDALASFVRSLISGDAPYDEYRAGKKDAISVSAKRGEAMFFDERTECFDCHVGFNLSGTVNFAGKAIENAQFENNGIYNIDGKGGFPIDNTGIFEFTGKAEDMGKFRVPSLRNVELTAPYMHDGSITTLEDVIEHYKAGGRNILTGEFKGDGSKSPLKSSFVKGFDLTAQEKLDMIEFLRSLTDKKFITDPRFSDPWRK